jgi:hypothetical protein
VRDLQADLKVAQPGVTILEVNGFLIRGSGRVDDIALLAVQETLSPSLRLTLFDPDTSGEGIIYINGNGPIDLPVGNYDNLEHTFTVSINRAWLVQGDNHFRFIHLSTQGYEVRRLCVSGLSASSISTTIPGLPSTTTTKTPGTPLPATTTISPGTPQTTTSVTSDIMPPTGSITINQGAEKTSSRLVTLSISAEDGESGMGGSAQMMLTKHTSEEWSEPMPYAPTKFWVLSPGTGEKTVYAKFCDAAGNWMDEPVSDSIELLLSCEEPLQFEAAAIDASGSYRPWWSGEKAVDGKIATGWFSRMRRVMQEEYITLDLGGVKAINRIDISSKRFIGRDLFPRDFKVQVSADMQNWIDVIAEQDYTLPASRTGSWTFDGTEAGYVKFVATRPQKFLVFYYLTYISEVDVFGCAEPEVPEPEGLAATQSAGESRSLLSKEAFDREVAAKKGPVIGDAVPGRPGKPLFILKENE